MGAEARTRVSLGALLTLTLFTFGQVFAESDYVGPALLAMVLAIALALVARHLGLGTFPTLVVSLGALVWYLTLVFASQHNLYGLPTPGAVGSLAAPIVEAYGQIQFDYAPVPARTGYVILLVAGMWLAGALGEIATVRWRRPLIAVLPPIGLFSLVMVVGTRAAASFSVALFVAALLTYLSFEARQTFRAWGRPLPLWSGRAGAAETADATAPSITGAMARRIGAATVAAAVVSPLFLPALGDGLLAWRSGASGAGGGRGAEINPLVSIAPRLISQTDEILFTVESAAPAYWRLVSLAEFDGTSWRPLSSARSEIDAGTPAATPLVGESASESLGQRFSLTGLGGGDLPAAVQATRIDFAPASERTLGDGNVIVDAEGALALDGRGAEDVRGLSYFVESLVPEVGYRRLRRAAADYSFDESPAPGPAYLQLPPDLSPEVYELAQRWTAGAGNPHDKLIALQERLRSFQYSLDVPAEATTDHLTRFLFETRAGYCQQFATAFAVLARTLGIPTRVSVGFLPGDEAQSRPDLFRVRGTHAHAWPEVYYQEVGWVAYEPTPRSATSPPIYTLPPLPGQARLEGGSAATTRTTGPPQDPRSRGELPRGFVRGGDRQTGGLFGADGTRRNEDSRVWEEAFNRLAAVIVLSLVVFLIAVPLLKRWRIERRYRRAATPADTTAAAFAHFVDEASELALPRHAAETPRAYAAKVAGEGGIPHGTALRLVLLFEAAAYGRSAVGPRQAHEAKKLALELRNRLWSSATWWARATRLFSPRALT